MDGLSKTLFVLTENIKQTVKTHVISNTLYASDSSIAASGDLELTLKLIIKIILLLVFVVIVFNAYDLFEFQ